MYECVSLLLTSSAMAPMIAATANRFPVDIFVNLMSIPSSLSITRLYSITNGQRINLASYLLFIACVPTETVSHLPAIILPAFWNKTVSPEICRFG